MSSLLMGSSASSMSSTENNFNLLKSNEEIFQRSFCFGGIISIGGFIICSIIIVMLLCMIRKYKKKLQKNINSMEFNNTDFSYSSLLKGQTSSFGNYQIDSGKIVIIKELGSHVSLSQYSEGSETKVVALKKISRFSVVKEIQALNSCKHKNIVSYFGMTEIDNQMCIVMEYMSGGNLHSFLINPKNTIFFYNIFSYIFQILDAMVYLSEIHISHRNLMARNCLLNATYEILKINDFGLAREMDNNYEYISEKSEAFPFRWMPLETLKYQKFTAKGDVWSFGILVWEIFQRGSLPYPNVENAQLVYFLESGERLPCPQYCPNGLYEIMKKCWNENPDERPTFFILKEEIKNMFENFNAVERKEPLTKMHEYVEIKLHQYESLKANQYINT